MNPREMRGLQIAQLKDQIQRIDDGTYKVSSQSGNGKYDILSTERGWACSCPDHQFRRVCCKHIHAVEISRKMRKAVQESVTIREIDLGRCKFCDSANVVKHGLKKLKKGTFQRFRCDGCGKHFTHNLGFERKRATPEQITMAVDLLFSGLSSRKTAKSVRMTGTNVSHVTVQNWAKEYSDLMDRFMDKITPQIGEQWRTDEIFLMIMGNRRYLFALLDTDTRYWLAKMVAEHKGNDDVEPLFREAREVAGKVPERLISDGAANFGHAHKKQYAAKNFLHKDSEHIRHIHMAGDMNNNQMESFNGNTVRLREEATRGLKREDSAILTGLRLYHNHVRPHQGLPGKTTPGEAAGIRIEGDNKWKTIIQNAAKQLDAEGRLADDGGPARAVRPTPRSVLAKNPSVDPPAFTQRA